MSVRHYWRARLVKDGPFVGVMSWFGLPIIDGEELDRHCRWQCLVRNETTSRMILLGDEVPIDVDGITLRNLERIQEADYLYLVKHSEWATNHAPDHPAASPKSKVNLKGKLAW